MKFFQELADAPLQDVAPGIRRFVFSLERVMGAYFELDPGTRIAEHAHPHEQLGILVRGKTRWKTGGEERVLEAPALYRIPSGQPHEVEVLGDEVAVVLDVFSPIREDFLQDGPPPYMRK